MSDQTPDRPAWVAEGKCWQCGWRDDEELMDYSTGGRCGTCGRASLNYAELNSYMPPEMVHIPAATPKDALNELGTVVDLDGAPRRFQ